MFCIPFYLVWEQGILDIIHICLKRILFNVLHILELHIWICLLGINVVGNVHIIHQM